MGEKEIGRVVKLKNTHPFMIYYYFCFDNNGLVKKTKFLTFRKRQIEKTFCIPPESPDGREGGERLLEILLGGMEKDRGHQVVQVTTRH